MGRMSDPYASMPLDQSPLLEFLLGYFHEDWKLDDPTESAVVARYRAKALPPDVARLVSDIDSVLSGWDDPDLQALISRHLISVQPEQPANEWLRWLRSALLAEPSETHPIK